jgi:TonB-linked SusC/RagA family outer membrane protein
VHRSTTAGRVLRVAAALVALALSPGNPLGAQGQQTSISGRVTATGSGEPLAEARVMVVGTSVATQTNAEGRYTLRGVPAGNVEVRVLRVGFAEQKKPVTVAANSSLTLDFTMVNSVVQLQEVVTTATGEQRRVELGNTVGTINVAQRAEAAPIKNMGDLLVGQTAGVQVIPGVMTGTGARVRVRGTSSLSLTNDPIYVIDGVRMTSDNTSQSIGVGGSAASRVSDINPEEIENIEIVKGPSAATLYGTDAANGVIVITTKRGKAGAPRWNVFGEQGALRDQNNYPTQYMIWGHAPATPTVARRCTLPQIGAGSCVKDSTSSLNLFDDKDETPIKDGWRNQVGAQLSGGTDALRFFTSGDFENEIGTLGMPNYDVRRFDSLKVGVLGDWARPNALQKASVRANLNLTVNSKLDLSAQSGYIKLDQRLPQVDNNVNSFLFNAFTGPGYKNNGNGSLGQPLMGWARFTPGDIFQQVTQAAVNRYIGSVNANWHPVSWMQNRADVGIDQTSRNEYRVCRLGQCSDFGTNRSGFANDARTSIRNFTANVTSTANWTPISSLVLKTTAGGQYVNYLRSGSTANGATLPPGAQTPASGTVQTVASTTVLQKTAGVFVEEQAAFRDRLFLTAAIRTDQNSAFGTDFQRVYYPKFSASWLASDEAFFPRFDWLDQFHLRASLGSAGVQPGPNDASRFYQVNTINIAGTDIASERLSQLGNIKLRPERSTEFETGFDSKLWHNRVSWDVTYYHKLSKDALIDQTIAPSAGSPGATEKANLGSVLNTGWESMITTQIIDRSSLGFGLSVNGSHNTNKLVALGVDATGKAIPPIINTNTRQIEGYPINGWWQREMHWSDKNGDGYIVPSEVLVDLAGGRPCPAGQTVGCNDGFRFMGYSQPRDEVTFQGNLEMLKGRRLRFNTLLDYKGGYTIQNREQLFLAGNADAYYGLSDVNASLFDRARSVAARGGVDSLGRATVTNVGFFENGQFWRLREVSASYDLGERLTSRLLRASGGSLNVAVRNLKTFTKFTGTDPEANFSQADITDNLLTLAPPTYVTFRLNLRY